MGTRWNATKLFANVVKRMQHLIHAHITIHLLTYYYCFTSFVLNVTKTREIPSICTSGQPVQIILLSTNTYTEPSFGTRQ